MSHSFFHLKRSPFQLSPNPLFFWLSSTHKEALGTLQYCLMNKKEFALITGDVGSGKSILINSFLENIEDIEEGILLIKITNPPTDLIDLFKLLAISLEFSEVDNKADFINQFEKFLQEIQRNHKRLLIIIDEAHKLTPDQLEELRLLVNMTSIEKESITFFFLGQNKLNQILLTDKCLALRSRIAFHYHIKPLTREETENYIAFRLLIAGGDIKIFSRHALGKIHELSDGNPRFINTICERSMMEAHSRAKKIVSRAIVKTAYKKILLPGEDKPDAVIEKNSEITAIQHFKREYIFNLIKNIYSICLHGKKHFVSSTHLNNFNLRTIIPVGFIIGAVILFIVWNFKNFSSTDITIHPQISEPQPESSPSLSSLEKSDSVISQSEADVGSPPPTKSVNASIKKKVMTVDNASPSIYLEKKKKTESTSTSISLLSIRSMIADKQFSEAIIRIEQAKKQKKLTFNIDEIHRLYAKAVLEKSKQLLKENQNNIAIELFLHAIMFDASNPTFYFELGKIFTGLGKYDEAVEMYGKSLEINPNNSGTYYNLGYIYFVKNNYNVSEKMFRESAKLNPPYLDKVLFNMAVVQYLQGKRKQCVDNLKEALRLAPDNKKAKKMLNKIEKLDAETHGQ